MSVETTKTRRAKKPPNEGVRLLKRWLDEGELTQNDCSSILGISYEHVSRLMSGFYKPGLELACRIEKECDIPPRRWLEK